MAEQKIFAGPRIRRIRNGPGPDPDGDGRGAWHLALLSQPDRAQPAAADGAAILSLSAVYKVDLEELQRRGGGGSMAALKRGVRRPAARPANCPASRNWSRSPKRRPTPPRGIVKLYRAYREQAGRLSDLTELLAARGPGDWRCPARACRSTRCATCSSGGPTISPQSRQRPRLSQRCSGADDELSVALKALAEASEHGIVVRVLPVATMPNLAPALRPPLAAAVPVRAAVALRPAARDRHGGLPASASRRAIAANRGARASTSDEARRLARFELGALCRALR